MKNIANSTNGPGPGNQNPGQDSAYKTTVWSPFGPSKVVTYKPVSFNVSNSIIGGSTLPTRQPQHQPFSQPTSSPISTAYSSASSSLGFSSSTQSPNKNASFLDNSNTSSGQRYGGDENLNSASPSYSNFNGSSNVIVTSPSSSTSYTSITMSSKKAEDSTPTHKYSRFGSPVVVLEGAQSPTKPFGHGSVTKSTFDSYQASSQPSDSPLKSDFSGSQGPQAFRLSDPPKGNARPSSPLKFGPSSTTKSNIGPGSPVKSSLGPNSPLKSSFGPNSPVKSNIGQGGPFPVLASPKSQRRPLSPSKSVTFGPVTSLGDNLSEAPEPQLSVSETRSLFEQRQNQPRVPQTQTGQQYKPVTPPSMQVKSPPTVPKSIAPSNTTSGATYRPLSPRVFSPSIGKKPVPSVIPKSPSTKSKGLAMFLSAQEKFREDDDDQLSEFTDSEETPRPKSPAPARLPKQPVQSSPIVGRAIPMKVASMGREGLNGPDDISLNNNNSINPTSTSIKVSSTTRPSPPPSQTQPKVGASPQPGLWQSEPDSTSKSAAKSWQSEQPVQAAPALWQEDKGYKPIKLDSSILKSPETMMRSVSPSVAPEESFAWKPPERTTVSSSTLTTTTTTTTATLPTHSTTSYTSHNGSISHHQESSSGLPAYQSPTITLLQKSRELAKASENLKGLLAGGTFDVPSSDLRTVRVAENEIPDGAVLVGTKESTEGNKKHYDSFYRLPGQQKETKTQKVVDRKKSQYEGIGPTDEKTGVPIVPRGSVDEKNHKDWYKQMYQSLHKQDRKEGDPEISASESEEANAYKPTYVFPEEDTESEFEERGSTMSLDRSAGNYGGYGRKAYTLPHARYREDKYKNQPRSIENYEPGFSSIAFREARVSPIPFSAKDAPKSPEPKRDKKQAQSHDKGDNKSDKSYLYNPPIEKPGQFSKYTYSDSEHEIKKKERALSPASDVENRDAYRRFQKGGDVPYEGLRFPVPPKKERSLSTSERNEAARQRHVMAGGRSPTGSWDRKRREEEIARRKQEMHRITHEEKRKRMEMEMRANEARRHNDFLTPSQKSPIALNRYEDPPDAPALQRPKKKMTQYKGKAKALYNFKSQNTKELSFRKNDVILLLRQIDKNWYEGEHHGRIGIFPVNYVEVLTSLDEAREAAILREGQGKARHSFTAHSNMELSFRKGETVSLVRRIDDNWYEGRCGLRHGIFPISYVDILTEPDTPYSSYAPTPMTGSPSQLSPVSTISNGPAPTIPSAPISPRSSIDNFDFGQPYNYGPNMSAASTLQRASGQRSYQSDYGMDMLRPSSALGGHSDSYDSMTRDRYNLMNRPSSAVPFSDYYGKHSTRDSGFQSSDESRYPRQQSRQQDPVSRSMSNSYEARIRQNSGSGSRPLDDISLVTEETKYPKYRALYTYKPQNADELALQEGDIVYVMEVCDDDWYVGTSDRTKEFGTFPGNYVKIL